MVQRARHYLQLLALGLLPVGVGCSTDTVAPPAVIDISGKWIGGLTAGQPSFTLTLTQTADGTLGGSASIFPPAGYRVSGQARTRTNVTFRLDDTTFVSVTYEFQGTVDAAGRRMTGSLSQLGIGSPYAWVRQP